MRLKIFFLESRPQFLLLSVTLAFLGTTMAWYYGAFALDYALLAFIGLLLAHTSVNVLNDYFDYKSGVDLNTQRTPFSGGSGILPAARMKPDQALRYGVAAFLISLAIGIYFIIVRGWLLVPVVVIAAICVTIYTPFILRTKWPEWSPGVGLGFLPVLGVYFVQTGNYTVPAIIASIPAGFMVHNLLLLNEFPDIEADRKAGRKTMPITLGRRKASLIYSAVTIAVYVWIVSAVIARVMPVFTLIALLTLPFAIKAIRGALKNENMGQLIPAMANNVLFILSTQLLTGVGYILSTVINV